MLLITGAAGASGRLIVKALSQQGLRLRALIRHPEKAELFSGMQGVEVQVADLARPQTLGPALDGVDTALLISSADERMLETQCAFVDAAHVSGVRRIVKFSGQESGIGFDAKAFRFTRMHDEIEAHIEGSGLRWTHLRPSQFMQVYLREAPSIATAGVLALPTGDIELSPVDLADIASIAAGVLADDQVDGQRLVITGPQALTMHEVARAIEEAIGRRVSYRPVTIEERSARLKSVGMAPFTIDALAEQAAERLRHPRSLVDLSTHERYGVPATTFAQFARNHRAMFSGSKQFDRVARMPVIADMGHAAAFEPQQHKIDGARGSPAGSKGAGGQRLS
jgi:uncharacterized protein YbjT (DUF2867 family)